MGLYIKIIKNLDPEYGLNLIVFWQINGFCEKMGRNFTDTCRNVLLSPGVTLRTSSWPFIILHDVNLTELNKFCCEFVQYPSLINSLLHQSSHKVLRLIPPSYPTCFPYPNYWNLGVGEAGPKIVGEAEKLCFWSISMNIWSTNWLENI